MLYYKILNEFLQILEKEIISNNGIIYDKFACASLLASYNKMQYLRKKLPIDQFYDISFDKLTIDLLLFLTLFLYTTFNIFVCNLFKSTKYLSFTSK